MGVLYREALREEICPYCVTAMVPSTASCTGATGNRFHGVMMMVRNNCMRVLMSFDPTMPPPALMPGRILTRRRLGGVQFSREGFRLLDGGARPRGEGTRLVPTSSGCLV